MYQEKERKDKKKKNPKPDNLTDQVFLKPMRNIQLRGVKQGINNFKIYIWISYLSLALLKPLELLS